MTKVSSHIKKPKIRSADEKGMIVVQSPSDVRDRLEVPMSASLMGSIRANPAGLERLIRGFGKSIETARETGQPSGFSVKVDATGKPSITTLDQEATNTSPGSLLESASEDVALEDSLAAARGRGAAFGADLLSNPDMLSADELARRSGVTRMTINVRRRQHELLGLEGAKRGFRFPAWQLDARGRAFPEIAELFAIIGDDPWEVFRFLTQRHAALDGDLARVALADGRGDDVIIAARAYADGSFS